jgi:hypothetical protein
MGETELRAQIQALCELRDRLSQRLEELNELASEYLQRAERTEVENKRLRAELEEAHESALDFEGLYRHALDHVVDCDDNCGQCRRLAQNALDRGVDTFDLAQAILDERDRLRAVVDAVRVMWDNIVGTENEAVMGFPISDYNSVEEALDVLDGSEVMGGESVGARIKREGEHGRQVLLDRMVADSSCTAERHDCGLVVDVTTGAPTRAICRECGRRWNVESAHHEGTDGKPDA